MFGINNLRLALDIYQTYKVLVGRFSESLKKNYTLIVRVMQPREPSTNITKDGPLDELSILRLYVILSFLCGYLLRFSNFTYPFSLFQEYPSSRFDL